MIAFDSFNEPGRALPTHGDDATLSFTESACLVLKGTERVHVEDVIASGV